MYLHIFERHLQANKKKRMQEQGKICKSSEIFCYNKQAKQEKFVCFRIW